MMFEDPRGPLIRAWAESVTARRYWYGVDGHGGRWLFESVEGDGEHWAVKQVEIAPDGQVRRYWWGHPQDDHGFLTDQALNPEGDGLAELTPDAFQEVWRVTECACGADGQGGMVRPVGESASRAGTTTDDQAHPIRRPTCPPN